MLCETSPRLNNRPLTVWSMDFVVLGTAKLRLRSEVVRALGVEPRTFLYPAHYGRSESVECSTSPRVLAPPGLGGVRRGKLS